MNSPFFSVVIPTYNRADLLPFSIKSVLDQSLQDFEIIVVDNFSSDNTREVMERYKDDQRIRYFRNEANMERAYSRNVGFRNANGEYLTLLDSDDIMYETCLEDAFNYVQRQKAAKVFHNLYEFIDENGRPSKRIHFSKIKNQYKEICKRNFLSCIGVFLHKAVYNRYMFTEDWKMIGSEDYEIWFRILAENRVGRIEKVNSGIRQHDGRSVFGAMYENLEYQRLYIINMIERNEKLRGKYLPYLRYINANYYFHQAIYALHKKQKRKAIKLFADAILKGKGTLFSIRTPAFIKNIIFAPSH